MTSTPLELENVVGLSWIAQRAGCTRENVRRAIQEGRLPATKVHARRFLVTASDAEAFITAYLARNSKPVAAS